MNKSILQGALFTVLTLFGGLLIGLVLGDILFKLLPGSDIENPSLGHMAIAAVPALGGFLAGGAAWGAAMGKVAGTADTRRMALAGMFGFAPITITLALGLSAAEPGLVANYGAVIPVHRIFMLMFVPSAFIIAGISAWALGRGLRDNALAVSMLWRVGGSAGLAFVIVTLGMELSGWVVGAPGAAARATMVTVLAAGNLGVALVGGGVMGWLLWRAQTPSTNSVDHDFVSLRSVLC
ncbi:MAG: hypothetical protein ACE5GO_07150 [Anaerolineales bacterium]